MEDRLAGMLESLEQALENAFEGSILRLFKPPVQPIQIAKAAAKQMERKQRVGLSGPEVPNDFVVRLAPKDFEVFEPYQEQFCRELEAHLERICGEQGWHPAGPLQVALMADATSIRGRPTV